MKKDPQHFNIEINGHKIETRSGQTIAAALIAAGITTFRKLSDDETRGLFCGMGVCFDCLVSVNGVPDQRACITIVHSGMQITLNTEVKPE